MGLSIIVKRNKKEQIRIEKSGWGKWLIDMAVY